MTTLQIAQQTTETETPTIASVLVPVPEVLGKGIMECAEQQAPADTRGVVAVESPGIRVQAVWVCVSGKTQTIRVMSPPPSARIAVTFKNWRALIHHGAIEAAAEPVVWSSALADILRSLGNLRREPEFDDYGILRPTEQLVRKTTAAVTTAYNSIGPSIELDQILPHVATDHDGAIRISWRRGQKQMRLVLPAMRDAYVYVQHDGEYRTHKLSDLENQLRWLID